MTTRPDSRRRTALLLLVLVGCLGLLWWALDRRRPRATRPAQHPAAPRQEPRRRTTGPLPGTSPVVAKPGTGSPRPGRRVVTAGWGSGPAELGRREAQESNPEGPMAVSLDSSGQLLVLDQVNRRVLRFDPKSSRLISSLPIRSETAQDLLTDDQGRTHVLSRLGPGAGINVYAPGGQLTAHLSVVGGKVSEAGAVTGLLRDPLGVYVESQHDDLIRVANKPVDSDMMHVI